MNLLRYFNNPIPKEIWDEMPRSFRNYIRKELIFGYSNVRYTPKLPKEYVEEHPMMRMWEETITIDNGPLASRTYNARTGVYVAMS